MAWSFYQNAVEQSLQKYSVDWKKETLEFGVKSGHNSIMKIWIKNKNKKRKKTYTARTILQLVN